LAISPKISRNIHPASNTANTNKPLKSQGTNKTNKLVVVEDEKRSVTRTKGGGKKITDYLVARRTSNRKTQEALREEKHQMLIKMILDETEDGLIAKRFSGKGRGVMTCKRFLKNEFVVEYAGQLMTATEARAKDAKYARDGFAGCYMYYFTHNNQQYCVDATEESGRMGRLINHSRNGCLMTKVVEVKGVPRLIFIAKRDIDVDEELTYDYGDRSRESLRHHPWLAF
jgi:histone-lysine N-methyltransferase SETD8